MKRFTLLFVLLAAVLSMQAQNTREFIKQHILDNNECKSVAITQKSGDVMIYARNGWAAEGCPEGLMDALHELNFDNEEIQDVTLTDKGNWLVLFGNNGMHWNKINYDLLEKMIQYNNNAEKITTVSFNDKDEWILITTESISASSNEILEWLGDGCDKYGQLWTACITNDAIVAVYESGYKFWGDVPEDLTEQLINCSSNVYMVKMSGDAWFFRCTDGHMEYNM